MMKCFWFCYAELFTKYLTLLTKMKKTCETKCQYFIAGNSKSYLFFTTSLKDRGSQTEVFLHLKAQEVVPGLLPLSSSCCSLL